MHWHAMRRASKARKAGDPGCYDGTLHGPHVIDEENLHITQTGTPIRQGQDDALDSLSDLLLALPIDDTAEIHPGYQVDTSNRQDESITQEDNYLQVYMPAVSTGLSTFAYQRALTNRIKDVKIARHGEYDSHLYTPTFIHDCLMLPGSLANVLGKVSPEEIIHRMTPALLPGFHAHVHSENQQPCLLQSSKPDDYVKGMVIFGQGTEARDCIHEHYRPHARRVKVQVEIEVQVPGLPSDDDDVIFTRWYLKRKKIWAHAWLWSNASSADVEFRGTVPDWTLEGYLAGNLSPTHAIRIDCDGGVGEDYEPSTDTEDSEDEQEEKTESIHQEREVNQGGCGIVEYQRSDAATGWW